MQRMKLVVFGLSISSSWGNGHATLWRGLCRALAGARHRVVFFERDTPYYRRSRDLERLETGELVLYEGWASVRARALRELRDADAAIVTSYCPDGAAAAQLLLEDERALRVFYDLDTPVTLAALDAGESPPYLGERKLADYDLVLSFTGGNAPPALMERLGARQVDVLYGHVDPHVHHPVPAEEDLSATVSYLGTYAADRHARLAELLLAPAAALPERRFVLAGSLYPEAQRLPPNVVHFEHLVPARHAALFCSSQWTLNVTRDTMARLGYCPSGRLFEAAACGAPLLSDWFEGLDLFFEPGREIQVVRDREDVLRALSLGEAARRAQARAAQRRVLAEHTAERRAQRLIQLLSSLPDRRRATPGKGAPLASSPQGGL